jgi:polysaccharide biosynthesis protein PelA
VKSIIFAMVLSFSSLLGAKEVPRKIIALYDGAVSEGVDFTRLHNFAEMPLNHLGYIFEYHDIRDDLPDLRERGDVIGVLMWIGYGTDPAAKHFRKLFDWAVQSLDAGKKYVVMGNPVFIPENTGMTISELNVFWEKLGLRITGQWVSKTYDVTLGFPDPTMSEFERAYSKPYPSYIEMIKISKETKSFVTAYAGERVYPESTLAAIAARGGYVASGYEIHLTYEPGRGFRQWYINPFLFFGKIFDGKNIPKPDTTTVAGRRIYYSHIDGDGWNNMTEIRDFSLGAISAEVIYERIVDNHPELPVTVGPIGAEISHDWVALRASRPAAEKMFLLPNVEVASHTFTHPYDWIFFEDYRPEDEVPYLHLYPDGSWLGQGVIAQIRRALGDWGYIVASPDPIEDEEVERNLLRERLFDKVFDVPRAFALEPFNLKLEMEGSVNLINDLTPEGKQVELYQWSGDCRPFFAALQDVDRIGVFNINGGDSRFDKDYPSYAWVAPLGREVGGLRQVYASNANEYFYTDFFRSNFSGFNLLPQTFKNTETPMRIRPMNLYYHIYSGQKYPSLRALEQNLEYIATQKITPIKASEFAALALGFYTVEITEVRERVWIFRNRGALQTIRFDKMSLGAVDYARSRGVVGQNYFQGSLYVYLDSAYPEDPVIALKGHENYHSLPIEPLYYLVESRWQISNLQGVGKEIRFNAVGYGPGEMIWNVPEEGGYEVNVEGGGKLLVHSRDRKIHFTVNETAIKPIAIKIYQNEN